MNSLTLDEDLLVRLRGIVEPVELRDPAGKLLGHYTPAVSPEVRAMYEKAKEMFDPEEMERIYAAEHGKGRPLADILEHLRSLEAHG